MTQHDLVIPGADSFGFRVNRATPLAKVVAVLRQHNPRAPYAAIRVAAEQLMLSGHEVSGERAPVRFDSGATGASEQALQPESLAPVEVDAPAAVEEGGSAPTTSAPDPAEQLAAWQPERGEVAAWVAKQRGLAKGLTMNKSGRVPARVLAAYREAHRDEYLASLVPVVNADGSAGEPMPAEQLDPQ